MRNFTAILAAIFTFAYAGLFAQTQTIELQENETKLVITNKSSDVLTFNSSVANFSLSDVITPKGDFMSIFTNGFEKSYLFPGEPGLPVLTKLIEIPHDADVQINIISADEEIIELSEYGIINKLSPTQPSISKSQDSDNIEFQYSEDVYNIDDFISHDIVSFEESGIMRGVRFGSLTVSPFEYNPVQNIVKVYTNIVFEVKFKNANHVKTAQLKAKYYSPYFETSNSVILNYEPIQNKDALTTWPISYVIIADRAFETTLEPFIEWKTKKGFNVIVGYTDVIGTTTTAIQSYIQNLYETETPTPTFGLLVGDVAQIPTYDGDASSHKTDLYYFCFDGGGDNFPDMYYGRFSAETTTELQAIIDKMLMHEQYTWPDDTFLDNCIMVAGVDGGSVGDYGYSHGDGQIFYGIDTYFTETNGYSNIYAYLNTTDAESHPYFVMHSNSASSDIKNKISSVGVGYVNYTAHCSSDGWADPSFSRNDISSMSNANMYPLMVSNCCQSNTFVDSDCFGEMQLYAENKGTIGCIGGSNYTYWDEDFYWGVGVRSSITMANAQDHVYDANNLGVYDGLYHNHGEDYSDWHITAGEMLMFGNMAVESSSSSLKLYYWEIYHLMGDPSIMAYLSIPSQMTISYDDPIPVGSTELTVTAEPYAYIAISQDGVLLDAVYTYANTSATLTFAALDSPGTADIVVTKQNRQPYIGTIEIVAANNPNDANLSSIDVPTGTIHISAATFNPTVTIKNMGTNNLTSCKVRYSIDGGTEVNYDWSGDLATYESDVVTFPQISLGEGNYTIMAYTILPNGTTDDYTDNDTANGTFTIYSGDVQLVEATEPQESYCATGTFVPTVTIQNNDANALTSATITYQIDDGSIVTESWTGNLAQDETEVITFADANLTQGSHSIVYTISEPNGGTDMDAGDNTITVDYEVIVGQAVILDLTTDNYGTETTWTLEDDGGTELYSGGPYTDAQTDYSFEFCLPVGCYVFTINDTYGDGICSGYGDGYYTLSNTETSETYGEGCDFGSQDIVEFCVVDVNQPPTPDFTSDVTSTCTGIVAFADQSSGQVDSYLWNFGDGNTSTEQNPTYTYTANGTYTVTLTSTNAYGSNTETKTDYITVEMPVEPTATGDNTCDSGSLTLSASGNGEIFWYDVETGGTPLETGDTYTTPVISTSTTYYAEDVISAPVYYVGSTESEANGNMFNNTSRYLIFDAFTDLRIVSVEVNAGSTNDRTIQLCDASGTVLQSATINIPAGVSRITLNFDVTAGSNYSLRASGTADMFRNDGSAVYPYEEAGVLSITGSSASVGGYYYFFYNWEVKVGDDCVSPRTAVEAVINTGATLSFSSTGETSGGANDGTATVTPTGNAPFTYEWNAAASSQTTATATDLAAGTYYVTVTDANGCTTSGSVEVSLGSLPLEASIESFVNPTCNGDCDGTITINASQGVPPYTYLWNDNQTTAQATGLCDGSYSVTIGDSNGGEVILSQDLTEPTALIASITTDAEISCNGACDGELTATVQNATEPIEYSWNGNVQTASIQNLCAGTYDLIATDVNGCTASASQDLTAPDALDILMMSNDDVCGQSVGELTASVTGGTEPYSYSWDNGGAEATISGLSEGTFAVTVIDANGCAISGSEDVFNVEGPSISVSTVDANCAVPGSASVTATGGALPYTFNWSSGSTTDNAADLAAGTYTVTVTDNNGCIAVEVFDITDVGELSITISSTDAHCGQGDGSITIEATSGTPDYTFDFSNGSTYTTSNTTQTESNLYAETYSVTVTDANGCNATETITVNELTGPEATFVTNNVTCYGGNDGSITAVPTGDGPFTYLWNPNGETTATIQGLSTMQYTLTLTDANGCINVYDVVITEPEELSIFADVMDNTCYDACDGSITLTVSGGVEPYTYYWTNGATDNFIYNICAGSYSVTISDANGCTAEVSQFVEEPAQMIGSISTTPASTNLTSDGTATVTVSGGTLPYTFLWSNDAVTPEITGLMTDYYCVTVTDDNNCSILLCDSVGYIVNVEELISNKLDIHPNPSTGLIYIDNIPSDVYEIRVVDVLGKTITTSSVSAMNEQVDLSDFRNGVYFIKLISDGENDVHRIVISK